MLRVVGRLATQTPHSARLLLFLRCSRDRQLDGHCYVCGYIVCTVITNAKQLCRAHGRLIISAAHGLNTSDAPPSWWGRRCCLLKTCRTAATMRRTTSRSWKLAEGWKAGATDFFVGGNKDIEFRLDNVNEDVHDLHDGSLNLKLRKPSFKNFFSAHKVTVTVPIFVVRMITRDWSLYKKDWLTLQSCSRPPRLLRGTGTNSVCRTRSGKRHQRELDAENW